MSTSSKNQFSSFIPPLDTGSNDLGFEDNREGIPLMPQSLFEAESQIPEDELELDELSPVDTALRSNSKADLNLNAALVASIESAVTESHLRSERSDLQVIYETEAEASHLRFALSELLGMGVSAPTEAVIQSFMQVKNDQVAYLSAAYSKRLPPNIGDVVPFTCTYLGQGKWVNGVRAESAPADIFLEIEINNLHKIWKIRFDEARRIGPQNLPGFGSGYVVESFVAKADIGDSATRNGAKPSDTTDQMARPGYGEDLSKEKSNSGSISSTSMSPIIDPNLDLTSGGSRTDGSDQDEPPAPGSPSYSKGTGASSLVYSYKITAPSLGIGSKYGTLALILPLLDVGNRHIRHCPSCQEMVSAASKFKSYFTFQPPHEWVPADSSDLIQAANSTAQALSMADSGSELDHQAAIGAAAGLIVKISEQTHLCPGQAFGRLVDYVVFRTYFDPNHIAMRQQEGAHSLFPQPYVGARGARLAAEDHRTLADVLRNLGVKIPDGVASVISTAVVTGSFTSAGAVLRTKQFGLRIAVPKSLGDADVRRLTLASLKLEPLSS